MDIKIRPVRSFVELSNQEVYDFARLRADVFIFEQGVVQEEDLDGKDELALHILAYRGAELVGYIRILLNEAPNEVWLGRMVVAKSARRCGIAYRLVKNAVEFILNDKELSERSIELSAQYYARGLYEKAGFEIVGEPYDEVEMKHIHMTYKK